MRRLTWSEVETAQRIPGRSALLFVTDRCPVGCAHCSVGSRRESPAIGDFGLFTEIVSGLAASPALAIVGLSGGEPFLERRGLSYAVTELAAAGKQLVSYTSGIWATSPDPPSWIAEVLARCSCVVLAADSYHAAGVAPERFSRAAKATVRAGAALVVQTLDDPRQVASAQALLTATFGPRWPDRAHLRRVPLLRYGRGARLDVGPGAGTGTQQPMAGERFGRCALAAAPVVRYDGRISACCNEAVVMGAGPATLRQEARTSEQVRSALAGLADDPFLTVIGSVGPGSLTAVASWRDLAGQPFPHICSLCWRILRTASGRREAAVLTLLAAQRREHGREPA